MSIKLFTQTYNSWYQLKERNEEKIIYTPLLNPYYSTHVQPCFDIIH